MGALIRDAVIEKYGLTDASDRLAALASLATMDLPVGTVAEMKAESVETVGEAP